MADILVVEGDIIWDGIDIAIIDSDENLKQQCYLRSITDEGENPFFKNYGGKVFDYVSKPFSYENKSKLESEIRKLLLNVEGIEMVSEVTVYLKEYEEKMCKMVNAQFIYNGKAKSFNFNFGV